MFSFTNLTERFIYAHTHTHAMVKVISLSNKAYQTLHEIKGSTESFSDVVIRLSQKSGDILSIFGCAQKDSEFIKGIKKAYQERDLQGLREY